MTRAWQSLAMATALLASPAGADVVLTGETHVGDNESVTFTPSDPMTLDEYANSATRFYLSEAIVVTAIRLDGLVQGSPTPPAGFTFRIDLDGVTRTGTYAGGTLTLSTARSLAAGLHLIAIDPGCLRSGVQQFGSSCRTADDEYDMSFSSMTLVTQDSTSITLARNLMRRRHLGDSTDASNDNFGGRWYPDAPEGTTLDIPFTLDRNLRLNEIRFYRLRDTASGAQALSRATVSIVDLTTGTVSSVGTLTGDGNPRTLSSSLSLLGGNYLLRVAAGQMKNPTTDTDKTYDDLRWNDALLLFGVDPTSTVGRFNGVDPDQNAVTGIVRTKTAGSPLDVDITALNNSALLLTHTGTVAVKLLDASSDSGALDAYGCRSSWIEKEDLGTVTFTLLDLGRKRLTAEALEAYPKARLLMTDTTLNVSGCSTDTFAVKPATFSVSVTHGTSSSAGTTTTLDNVSATQASPIHKAGQPFTIRATAVNADGNVTTLYSSSPTVLAETSVLGAQVGEARADLWTTAGGVAQTDVARYNEAGAFQLQVADTSFASVDAADTVAADRTIGPATVNVGRFVPDHFEVTLNTPQFNPACGAFTYTGQYFHYLTAPVATLTAVAFAVPPTTTTNYVSSSSLYKLGASPTGQSVYSALNPATGTPSAAIMDPSGLPTPDATISEAGDGTATVTLSSGIGGLAFLRSTPTVPFDAEIEVTLGSIQDSDGITTSSPVVFGGTATGAGIAFTGGANDIRFGRLLVDNAHGSERLDLKVPLRAEYWDTVAGNTGFVTSLGDTCTTTAIAGIFVLDPHGVTTSASGEQISTTGIGSVTLSAPNQTGYAGVRADLTATVLPWLRGDWDNDGNWAESDDDPQGRATFGVHKADDRRIYQQEVIGN
jgi:hypothetical protein